MATRTCDNKSHDLMMSNQCSCGEPGDLSGHSKCLRVILAEFYDFLETEWGYSHDYYARKIWIDRAMCGPRSIDAMGGSVDV